MVQDTSLVELYRRCGTGDSEKAQGGREGGRDQLQAKDLVHHIESLS
jgi:hypothetical protein